MDKRTLRRENFARIKALSKRERSAASRKIVAHLEELGLFQAAQVAFSFVAMSSEPDLDPLRSRFPEKKWGLSRVADDGENLFFHRVTPSQPLVMSPFGFSEPDPTVSPVITGSDIVLVPGVGFDPNSRVRLGRGKGHYDRYLGPLVSSAKAPTLIGICFATQLRELTAESHDVPMDLILTENGFSPGAT
ncbi:MAG: 5-formyltetrahydrofolate cyclo-ligase [Verrucomicrobiota bacterium]